MRLQTLEPVRADDSPDGSFGNCVLDFSGIGCKGGTVPFPEVPAITNILPLAKDDMASIQAGTL